jgi:hypothetical protein
MERHTMVIEDKETNPGQPKYVFVFMKDPAWGANTWEIQTPNNWIGIGSGEYRLIGWNSDVLAFYEGAWQDGQVRFKFEGIKYPNDCEPKPGISFKRGNGVYEPKYKWSNSALKLEWTGRNIAPDVP